MEVLLWMLESTGLPVNGSNGSRMKRSIPRAVVLKKKAVERHPWIFPDEVRNNFSFSGQRVADRDFRGQDGGTRLVRRTCVSPMKREFVGPDPGFTCRQMVGR